jgi:hypothetical protein
MRCQHLLLLAFVLGSAGGLTTRSHQLSFIHSVMSHL